MLLLFGVHPASTALAAVVIYRVLSLWIPAIIGTVAFASLRREIGKPLRPQPGGVAGARWRDLKAGGLRICGDLRSRICRIARLRLHRRRAAGKRGVEGAASTFCTCGGCGPVRTGQ